MRRTNRRTMLGLALAGLLPARLDAGAAASEDDDAALWAALRTGKAVAMMRHALAPGTGDPAAFSLGDCSTQRNLSDEGRAQARAIGERFRANRIGRAEVRSSQWCRCLETAELLGLGPVGPMPVLNSFFAERGREPAQTTALREHLLQREAARPLVLVSHQVNITALTGVFPASGEVVVVQEVDDGLEVIGTIRTAAR